MQLDQGGHLSHGSKANFMHNFFNFVHYPLSEQTEQIDYDQLEVLAKEHQPKLIIAGGSAYPRLIDYERISQIAKETGAYFMVDAAHIIGLVAAGVIPSPVPYADFVTASTTKTFSGPRSGIILCKEEHAKKVDRGVFPGALGSMHLHTMAAKCWLFNYCKTDHYQSIMSQVLKNAKALGERLEELDFRLVGGGTDTHLLLVDLRSKNISGKELDETLNRIGITVNKNQIPSDPLGPNETSGIRIGVTATTQRGMKENEMRDIADIFNQATIHFKEDTKLEELEERVKDLSSRFPLYSEDDLKYLMQ